MKGLQRELSAAVSVGQRDGRAGNMDENRWREATDSLRRARLFAFHMSDLCSKLLYYSYRKDRGAMSWTLSETDTRERVWISPKKGSSRLKGSPMIRHDTADQWALTGRGALVSARAYYSVP